EAAPVVGQELLLASERQRHARLAATDTLLPELPAGYPRELVHRQPELAGVLDAAAFLRRPVLVDDRPSHRCLGVNPRCCANVRATRRRVKTRSGEKAVRSSPRRASILLSRRSMLDRVPDGVRDAARSFGEVAAARPTRGSGVSAQALLRRAAVAACMG